MNVVFDTMPCDGPITGGFSDWYAGPPPYQHRGLDIGVPVGTPIVAPAAGVIVPMLNDGSFGQAVCIDHETEGFRYSVLAHNSELLVSIGDRVHPGQLLAKSGATGYVSGPHCHWQLCTSSQFPTDIRQSADPLRFFTEEDPMEKYRLSLLQIAGGDYDRLNMSYAKLAGDSRFGLPAQFDDDLNGAVVRRFAMIELAASPRAQDAYVALGGAL